MSYRVVVVDDQALALQRLGTLVKESGNCVLAGAASSGEEALRLCRETSPDLVILDVVLGHGMSGLETAERLKALFPGIRLVIVTSMPEVSFLERARALGAESFWYKELEESPLISVVERTLAGESVYPDAPPTVRLGAAPSTDLTQTELVVLRLMTTGATNLEIAQALSIEETTVKKHITNMLKKTGYRNRVELAVNARVAGLVIGGI